MRGTLLVIYGEFSCGGFRIRFSVHDYREWVDAFLCRNNAILRKMAAYRGVSLAYIQQSVWLVTLELIQQGNLSVNSEDHDQRREILRLVERHYVVDRRAKARNRSLDEPVRTKDNESFISRIDFVRARDDADPLQLRLEREEHEEQVSEILNLCEASYSQLSGYIMLLFAFDFVMDDAAEHLAITEATLSRRINWAYMLNAIQPSLFDRIVRLAHDFFPPKRTRTSAPKRRFDYLDQPILDFQRPHCPSM